MKAPRLTGDDVRVLFKYLFTYTLESSKLLVSFLRHRKWKISRLLDWIVKTASIRLCSLIASSPFPPFRCLRSTECVI
jgi:hypothetical protein